jgi:hypothetical protein
MEGESKSKIRNPKSETNSKSENSKHENRTLILGFGLAVFISLLTMAVGRAQETPPQADVNGWAPPAASKPALQASYVNPSTGALVSVPAPPPPVPSNDVVPTGLQQQQPPPPKGAMDRRSTSDEEGQGIRIELEPPGPDRIFGRRDSERSLQERIRQDTRQQNRTPFEFPEEPVLTLQRYAPRAFAPMTETVEPNYLCYKRLYFEDKNSERYGWDLGFIQPFVSTGIFFWDTATLPYRMGTEVCRKYECNSGYCMPGDPVPYLLYPPIWSVTGGAVEIGAIIAIAAIFPM